MKKTKVVVGMSGGMDSSAAASILVHEGYDVEGITLKVWKEEENPDRRWQDRSCCKVGLARYVSTRLGIPHRVIDVREDFREAVVDDFIAGYLAGSTPNPCVRCNERIKFGLLYQTAMELGADFLATGHYVRLKQEQDGRYLLLEGVDQEKDQSYFLYRLRPEIFPKLMFPLGGYRKPEVWKWIVDLDLPPEEMRESQEICFVTQGDYREFLHQEAPQSERRGHFVTIGGEVVGEHRGISSYTVGQRRGLGISSPKSNAGERLYVLGIEPETDSVIVGREEDLYRMVLTTHGTHYLVPSSPSGPVRIEARVRYRGPKIPATLEPIGEDRAMVTFDDPQRAVSPGQSVVFYQGDAVLGGGFIESSARAGVARQQEALRNAAPPRKQGQDESSEKRDQKPVRSNHE